MNPGQSASHAGMKEHLRQRAEAWLLFFESAEFNQRNMDAPVEAGMLHYLPFHPVTMACVSVMQMETPVRYAVNRATITQDITAVKNLGPLAFAVKSICMHSNAERDDAQTGKVVSYVGAQLTAETISNYKAAIGEEINLCGYAVATKEEPALADAVKEKVQGKEAVLLEITIECEYNLLRLDRHEYTPYLQQEESHLLLQDGMCLLVQNVEEIDGPNGQKVHKISLQNIGDEEEE